MASQAVTMVVPHVQSLFDGGTVAGLSDEQLLARFNTRRDHVGEAAFSALVDRHGPMVLGLCHRLVGDAHLAEDAFQAVFLVLARKAPSLRKPELLANWLYGVTVRTARNARLRQAGIRRIEARELSIQIDGPIDRKGLDPTVDPLVARESAELLHDEIDRLPLSFRLPVVLCYFEGLSLDDAAARLSWPEGTVRSRLARARDKLRNRLERRGVALSATALATILGGRTCSAAVSASLCSNMGRAATGALLGSVVSASATSLARETLRAGLAGWLSNVAKYLLILTTLGGAGYFAASSTTPPNLQEQPSAAKLEPRAEGNVDVEAVVEGRVIAHDTGLPLPHTVIQVLSFDRGAGGELGSARAEADDQGRYHAIVRAGYRYRIEARPDASQPYFDAVRGDFASLTLQTHLSKDLRLVRGAVIRGRVVEAGTDKRLANAKVFYVPSQQTAGAASGSNSAVLSNADGSYRIVVPTGKGRLFFQGPTLDYAAENPVANPRLDRDGALYSAHRILPYDATAGDDPVEFNAELRRGKTIRGRVVGPEGEPVDKATSLALLQLQSYDMLGSEVLTLGLRDGRFEVHGVEPNIPAFVMFLDPVHKWGAMIDLSSRPAGEEATIKLQACGQVEARFVGPDGKPVPRYSPNSLFLIVEKDHDVIARRDEAGRELPSNGVYVSGVDRTQFPRGRRMDLLGRYIGWFADKDGRMDFSHLIPGATYRMIDLSVKSSSEQASKVWREFSVKPGQRLDLGDILIANPPRSP